MTEEKIRSEEQPREGSAEDKARDAGNKKAERASCGEGEQEENGRGEGACGKPEEGGKFRSTGELRRAYEALEAEFTRKSQQLADLKR